MFLECLGGRGRGGGTEEEGLVCQRPLEGYESVHVSFTQTKSASLVTTDKLRRANIDESPTCDAPASVAITRHWTVTDNIGVFFFRLSV